MKKLKDFFNYTKWLLKRVEVFALHGKAGTGKSFRAKLIAEKYKIELIVDDGILIRDNKILAGKSAKKEKIKFTAIRTALLDEPAHVAELRNALRKEKFKKILIIGTSRKMVEKIAERLDLPSISRYISIEEIATREEIEQAKNARHVEGKHIIPVPGIEVKRRYARIFFDSVKIFFTKRFRYTGSEKGFEKSIVTPEYSKKGKLAISETALIQMIMHCIIEYNSEFKIDKIVLKKHYNGYLVLLDLSVPFGINLPSIIHGLQEYIIKNIELFTGITLQEVSITIGTIS